MHLAHLKLRDFRNYTRLEQKFTPGFHLILGDNGQGKTNLLEAIYLLATLRSFRGANNTQLIRQEQKNFFMGASVVGQVSHDIKYYWSSRQKKLTLDDHPVRKISDYLGALRCVIFCNEDLQLVKGNSSVRRRFIDLVLSQTQPGYLPLLQRYTKALKARNILLRQNVSDWDALDGFTHELVETGEKIYRFRHEFFPRFSPLASLAYRKISSEKEELRLEYKPQVKRNFAVELAQARHVERGLRCTFVGPHRDDYSLLLHEKSVADFGSEGQKRSVVIAMKMAQAEYVTSHDGSPPILLMDDVMGELDIHRRSALMPLMETAHQAQGQIFMTCTEENWPRELGRQLIRWEVNSGQLALA